MQAPVRVIDQPARIATPGRPMPLDIAHIHTRWTGNHASFLAEASRRLATSIDLSVTLQTVADLSVPKLGDACLMCLVDDDQTIHDVAVKHADARRQAMLAGLVNPASPGAASWRSMLNFTRNRRSLVLARRATAQLLEGLGGSPALVRQLDLKTTALVPVLHAETDLPLGVLVLLSERAQYFGGQTLRLARELAERSALALEVGQMYGACRATLMERQESLAITVHDLMSPLTVINWTAQRLRGVERSLSDADAICELRNRLEAIDVAAHRMTVALTTLLQSERDQHWTGFESTDLVALTHRVAADQQLTADDHVVRVIGAPEHFSGDWNAHQLERMLTNLVSNAIKYSPAGTAVEISLGHVVDQDGAWAVVEVSDEGVGIPAADLPLILKRFRRGSNVGDMDGHGLGLASVVQTVEAHAGRLSIDSREGEGTRVTVRLPLNRHATSTAR
jgi:signal transduction histidine kinase